MLLPSSARLRSALGCRAPVALPCTLPPHATHARHTGRVQRSCRSLDPRPRAHTPHRLPSRLGEQSAVGHGSERQDKQDAFHRRWQPTVQCRHLTCGHCARARRRKNHDLCCATNFGRQNTARNPPLSAASQAEIIHPSSSRRTYDAIGSDDMATQLMEFSRRPMPRSSHLFTRLRRIRVLVSREMLSILM